MVQSGSPSVYPRRCRTPWFLLLGIVLSLSGCSDDLPGPTELPLTMPLRLQSLAPSSESAAPPGIGGSVTLPAQGTAVTNIPLRPSGIYVPPGIAAYVEVSGQIARQLTQGAKQFCGLFPEDCEALARYIEETPYYPWGFPEAEIGTALVGWDGAGEELVQEGRRPLAGVSGEELWIGRYGFYCTYQYWIGPLYVSGPCLTFDGSFTYTVRPDDGDGALSLSVIGNAGGEVDLLASVPDDAEVSGIRWHFVPDGGGTIEEPAATRTERSLASDANTASSGLDNEGWTVLDPVSREEHVVESMRELPAGIYFVRPPTAAGGDGSAGAPGPAQRSQSMAIASASAVRSLAGCDGELVCSTLIDTSAGTFVVSAEVNGVPRSAEARVETQAKLKVSCNGTSVMRGDKINCKLSTEPEGLPIEEPEWIFKAGEIEKNAAGINEWGGPMVISGIIIAQAKVSGAVKGDTVPITVDPRLWHAHDVEMTIKPISPTELPLFPESESDLGYFRPDDRWKPGGTWFTDVSGGPNVGLVYVIDIPLVFYGHIDINYPAMEPSSEFMRNQRGSSPSCTQRDLHKVLPAVIAHEGLNFEPNSHAARYRDKARELTVAEYESLVTHSRDDMVKKATDIKNEIAHVAQEHSDAIDHPPLLNNPMGCNLNFDRKGRR